MKKPELFRSTGVFQGVMHILECHNIRLPVRQRIIDMFGKDVLRQIVLEEDSDDDEEFDSNPNTARPTMAKLVSPLPRSPERAA